MTLNFLGHLSIWDLQKALDGLLEKAPNSHAIKTVYSCREVELPPDTSPEVHSLLVDVLNNVGDCEPKLPSLNTV